MAKRRRKPRGLSVLRQNFVGLLNIDSSGTSRDIGP
jgi:hypothetical protein